MNSSHEQIYPLPRPLFSGDVLARALHFLKKSLATLLTYLFREATVLTYLFQYDGGGNGVADEERKEVDTEA